MKYANPATPLSAGFTDIGGYNLAFVTNDAYDNNKILQVYWAGVRYTVIPRLDLTVRLPELRAQHPHPSRL